MRGSVLNPVALWEGGDSGLTSSVSHTARDQIGSIIFFCHWCSLYRLVQKLWPPHRQWVSQQPLFGVNSLTKVWPFTDLDVKQSCRVFQINTSEAEFFLGGLLSLPTFQIHVTVFLLLIGQQITPSHSRFRFYLNL